MKMFDDNEGFTKEALQLCDESQAALDPVIDKWIAAGYNIRDIEAVITEELSIRMCVHRIDKKS